MEGERAGRVQGGFVGVDYATPGEVGAAELGGRAGGRGAQDGVGGCGGEDFWGCVRVKIARGRANGVIWVVPSIKRAFWEVIMGVMAGGMGRKEVKEEVERRGEILWSEGGELFRSGGLPE